MIKTEAVKIKIGNSIYLQEAWHEKVEEFSGKPNLPYEYEIESEIVTYEKVYICKGMRSKKEYRIALGEDVIKYLFGTEVPDSNIGFAFKDYLPLENTDVLITNIKNPSNVIAAKLILKCDSLEYEDFKYPVLDFILEPLSQQEDISLSYHTCCKRANWKFLFNKDIEYMNDYERMFQDTYIHKSFVMKSCNKLADYLRSKGIENHAAQLIERGKVHDNSKVMCEDELRIMSSIINDKSSLADAKKSLSQIKADAIKLHWKHNSHHPEHFKNYADMERIDIMEMCCDWCARAMQYETDLIEFVNIRQEERFHFPEWIFLEIMHYCKILIRD
jgi:hypothetical protein